MRGEAGPFVSDTTAHTADAAALPRCPAGHVFDEVNTANWRESGRTCRACRRAYQRQVRQLEAERLALHRAEASR